ncbi:hypothetical protein ACG83_25975 [Frankia sp. R43]|uniref:hypothetical protein n=1 Tax=Frankia sp. R43 TaxID=269536 RepID=UPI0006CA5E5F|nr:hypothetical protein [Frankia sp. R43]KPM52884.1 hypothetical protein ACG83_25975 [Frankia sp. R43]
MTKDQQTDVIQPFDRATSAGDRMSLTKDLDGGVTLTVTLDRDEEGRLCPRGIEIGTPLGSLADSAPITAAAGSAQHYWDEAARIARALEGIAERLDWRGMLRTTLADRPSTGRYEDDFYALIALGFMSLTTGGSRRPMKDLAEAVDINPHTVHRWLNEARRRALLTSPERGQMGGRLTTTAQELIDKLGRGSQNAEAE